MNRALAILAAVFLAHYGYLSVDEQSQAWAFYILRGVEGVVIGLALLGTFPRGNAAVIGAAACWLLIIEEAQTAVCGYLAQEGSSNAICVEYFGATGYAAIICAVVAGIVVWRKR